KHQLYYQDTPETNPQITFHLDHEDAIIITAHHSIFEGELNTAHIEISKRFDTKSLRAYHAETLLTLTTDSTLEDTATSINQLDKINITTIPNGYRASLKIATLDGNVYITLTYPKIDLLQIINEGSNRFLSVLVIIATLFILIMYLFYHVVLIKPLDKLMYNIQHIKHRDFSNLNELNSNDELDEIATHVDSLAKSIQTQEDELKFIASHDALTHLYNRYHFNSIINHQIQDIQKDQHLALIFIDVDEFKTINDTLGHDVGDKLLVTMSQRLTTFVPPHSNLSRIGGDEFMIVLPKIDTQKELSEFAQQLHALFDEPFIIDTHYLNITISSGIVLTNNSQKDLTNLYKEADIALYKSKERGRDQFTIYKEEFSQELNERTAIINGLKDAIKQNFEEFYLLYQPKVSTLDGKTINGVESLIRWKSPLLGLMPPDKFIAIAEESGLIIELGYWIIERSCRDFLLLQHEGVELHQVSINISSVQFASKDFLKRVEAILKEIGIDPKYIEFELTERIIAHDDVEVLATLNTLKSMGIDIAIDDFGTGYSSLSYLRKLPVDRIKIDKSFVTDIDRGEAYEIVQSAIVPLAKALHLATTAEGVERQEEFAILKNIGVDDIQGFYFAKPMSIEKLKIYAKN
ncbi:MAG: EAL domain-containing protein, partial [Campylobacterales bacterium]|nr:EAL domain-containing protein [Campylobacterales bacterium]